MARNVFGSLLALIGATAVVWSPFRAWYDGRHGRDVRVDDLFTGLDGARGADTGLLRSLFLPMVIAALIALVGLALRSRLLVALAGLVALGFTVLWMVRQGQAAGSLTVDGEGNGLGIGVAGALGGAVLLLLAAPLLSRHGAGRRRRAPAAAQGPGTEGPGGYEAYGARGAYGAGGPYGRDGPPEPVGGPATAPPGAGPVHRRPDQRGPGTPGGREPPLAPGYAAGAYQRDPHEPEAYPRDLYAPTPHAFPQRPQQHQPPQHGQQAGQPTGPHPPYGTGPHPPYGTGPHPPYGTGPHPPYGAGPEPGPRPPERSSGASRVTGIGRATGASAGTGPTPPVTWPAAPQAEREDKTIEMPPVTDDRAAPDAPYDRTAPEAPYDTAAPDAPYDTAAPNTPDGPGGTPYGPGDPYAPGGSRAPGGPHATGGSQTTPPESDVERTLPQPPRRDEEP